MPNVPQPALTPPLISVLKLISSALRMVGLLASGTTPRAVDAQDALLVLNGMLDSFNAERLMIFVIAINQFPLTVNKQVYTCGTGGDFDMPRPPKIERVSIISLQNPDQPQELPMNYYTVKDWQSVPVKNVPSPLPEDVYDDQAFPLRNISVWPIPTVGVDFKIYSWLALSQFADLNTIVSFPPGYQECLRYNLAVRLMAEYPGSYNPVTAQMTTALAIESKARVKSMNLPILEADADPALMGNGGRYNYYSDMPVNGRFT